MHPKRSPQDEKILVLGAGGQLGKAFEKLLGPQKAIYAQRTQCDLSQIEALHSYLDLIQPTIVINAAAYTQVDRAETEMEMARLINTEAPAQIAHWCARHGASFIHFSTDYVFSGMGETPWKESDPISPINTYGSSKAQGEIKVQEAGGCYLIFRTSWVYDTSGKNFLRTILRLARERDTLRIVHDQVGAPTFAEDLAQGAWTAFQKARLIEPFPSGIYHLCGSGETTWFQFAQAILEEADHLGIAVKAKKLEPICSSEFPTPAKRPLNSRMDTSKVFNQFQVKLPHWRESLNRGMTLGIKELT